MSQRHATVTRQTKETSIRVALNLDADAAGGGDTRIATGVGFFDHMLEHLARHGRLGLVVEAEGDTHVDDHHTVEDVGLALGQALDQAMGEKRGIERFGFASVPMDEALARASIDLSGRAALVFDVAFQTPTGKIGAFDIQLIREFFRALTSAGRFNAHLESPRGENDHHIAEALFKAFAHALHQAVGITGEDVPSTKGSL